MIPLSPVNLSPSTLKVTTMPEVSGLIDYGDGVSVRPSVHADALHIGNNMRQADRDEMFALLGETNMVKVVTRQITSCTECYTILKNDRPIAVFGLCEMEMGIASIGLLSTDELLSIKLKFMRQCKKWVKSFNADYNLLFNVVGCENLLHVTWLKWLGFTFLRRIPGHGKSGEDFYEFARLKEA